MSNQNRQIPVMDAGDAELIAMHAVLRLLERCTRPATVPVLLTITDLYENRGAITTKQNYEIPVAAQYLMIPYRINMGT